MAMSKGRRFLFRFTLAALGMVMFCLFAFVGFGWVVWRHWNWLEKVMDGDRENRIWEWYGHAAAGLAPWDSDGDGYCDGLELFLETDPQKSASRPAVNPRLACRYERATPFCGEWSHRWCMPHIDGFIFGWVPGTQILVSVNHPAIVFRRKVGDPESSTLTIAANAAGEIEFEVGFKAPVVGDVSPNEPPQVLFADPKNGDKFWDVLQYAYGWRGSTVPVTFCDIDGVPLSGPRNPDENTFIVRPADWEKAAWFLLERRRKGSHEVFHGGAVIAPAERPAIFFLMTWVEEGSQPEDYDWQITAALKSPP